MRDLIATFSAAAKVALVNDGWRKRSGDIFTRDLGEGSLAWLGLNRASTQRPLHIHPVAGIRHEATMKLCDELAESASAVTPTLCEPVAYLGEETIPDLAIGALSEVPSAVSQLIRLVETRALPFAESYRDPDRQLEALRARRHVPIPDYAIVRRPAMLAVLGRTDEAIDAVDQELATLGTRTDAAAQEYRKEAQALRSMLVARR